MQRKFSLCTGTAVTATLFVLLHAVLAAGTIFWIAVLIPAMLFKWSIEDRKVAPVQSVARRGRRI